MSGGFHRTKRLAPHGEPSSATTSKEADGRPVSRPAWAAGSAIVAEQQAHRGCAP